MPSPRGNKSKAGPTVLDLPSADDPSLDLFQATRQEKLATFRLNGSAWAGPLSIPDYIERELHLGSQLHTRGGRITYWVLAKSSEKENQRTMLASCETIKKRAWLAKNGKIQEVVAHAIGSVFCNPEFRGRGYAKRMMELLAEKLKEWQQPNDPTTKKPKPELFSVLFSDIGKEFYAKAGGWMPMNSTHISLPPKKPSSDLSTSTHSIEENSTTLITVQSNNLPKSEYIPHELVTTYCRADCTNLYNTLGEKSAEIPNISVVALLPDPETFLWHHAREEFQVQRLCPELGHPTHKGAWAHANNANLTPAAHVMWTRSFGAKPSENVLYILRVGIRGDEQLNWNNRRDVSEIVHLLAVCLLRAQEEAKRWGMRSVQIWNPNEITLRAAKFVNDGQDVEIIERENDSICSMKWDGEGRVEWWANEKFAWC